MRDQSTGKSHSSPEYMAAWRNKNKDHVRHYTIWRSMIARCHNPKAMQYHQYGGRGISVCVRWRSSYEHFLEDMGLPPKGMTIERKNNGGNYELGNCRWASMKEQCRNRRSNRFLTHNGQTRTIAEWSEITGLPASTIGSRLRVCKFTIDKALTQPLRGWGPGKPKIDGG